MNLSSHIKSRGLTDEQFGQEAGLHKSAISRYRRGLVKPGWSAMTRIFRASQGEVTPNDFFGPLQESKVLDKSEVPSRISLSPTPEQGGADE